MKEKTRRVGSINIESNSVPAGKFSHFYQKKRVITSLFELPTENWMYSPGVDK